MRIRDGGGEAIPLGLEPDGSLRVSMRLVNGFMLMNHPPSPILLLPTLSIKQIPNLFM